MKISDKRIVGLRTDYDISDEDFEILNTPFDNDIDSWIDSHADIINEFIAFYISSGIKHNALWDGALSGFINSAIATFTERFTVSHVDMDKIKNILLCKYNIDTIDKKAITFNILNK